MTVSTVRSGVGLRYVQVFALAEDYPAATSTTAYEGVSISGARSLSITDPEPRQINHVGDDRLFALDVLPPTEPVTAELRVAKVNDTLDAVLGDDLAFTVGEAQMFGVGTSNRGEEDQVGILAYRQALDTDPTSSSYGTRRWSFYIIPKAIVVSREGSMDDNPEEKVYSIYPQLTKEHLWGLAFSTATEGFLQAQIIRGVSEYKPHIVAWQVADTAAVTLSFPSAYPAQSTSKITVWHDGVLITPGTLATGSIEFAGGSLSTSDYVVCFYEVA